MTVALPGPEANRAAARRLVVRVAFLRSQGATRMAGRWAAGRTGPSVRPDRSRVGPGHGRGSSTIVRPGGHHDPF